MDKDFISSSLKYLLPILTVCSLTYVLGHVNTDYFWHLTYQGDGAYPPFISWILAPLNYSPHALFVLNLLFSIFIPFCLINRIAGLDAAKVYLLSGIPLILFVLWTVPQSIIMCLMLACVAEPLFLISFVFLGAFIHQTWWIAFIMTCAYGYYRRRKKEAVA